MSAMVGLGLWIGVALLGLLAPPALAPVANAAADNRSVAFVHVDVLPMDAERILTDRTVVVADGRILTLGPSDEIEIPADALRIDGRGRTLMPALCDMHVHLGGNAWNAILPIEEQQPFAASEAERELRAYLAHGVTTIAVMSAAEEHLALRDRIESGQLLAPRLILARMIDTPPAAYPPPLAVWVKTPEEARAAVRRAAAEGYDRIKIYAYAARAVYDALVDEATAAALPVDGHIPFAVSLEHALSSGQASIAHIAELARFVESASLPDTVRALADRVASSGVRVVTTLTASRTLLAWFDDPERAFAPASLRTLPSMTADVWRTYAEARYLAIPANRQADIRVSFEAVERPLVRALADAGVGLVLGTDAYAPGIVPGLSVHQELRELVDAGLTPYEALRAATTEPFALLGETSLRGTIEVGRDTDLLLIDGDPLRDIANVKRIVGVLIRGTWLSAEHLADP